MKNKFPLIIAVVMGGVALLAIHSYVKKVEQKAQAQLSGDPVVVATRSIAAGAELSLEMLASKEVPAQFTPRQSISAKGREEVNQIVGRKTRVEIKPGQIILWSDLASETRGGLSTFIPAGEGAYTIAVAKGIKPALIQPSDHVDIIGSFTAPKPNQPLPSGNASWRQGSDMVNVVLLQNVTVLAVGETFGTTAKNPNASAGELTLSLTLPESQMLMFASEHGELGAVLRREGAEEVKPRPDLPRVTYEVIEKIIGDLDGRRNVRLVKVEKGSDSDTIPISTHGEPPSERETVKVK